MGSDSSLLLIHRNGSEQELKLTIHTKQPKYAERPYSEPQAILVKHLDSALGYLKVSLFPGMIGIDFARDVDKAIAELQNCDRLILDVRGNPGGGIGGLRLMSYLTSKKLPVGYSLSRQKASGGYNKEDLPRLNGIPNYKWQLPSLFFKFARRDRSIAVVTEGRPPQRWHGRLVVLTNEHTRGSAEMLAAFVRENGLGILVGQNTGGKLRPVMDSNSRTGTFLFYRLPLICRGKGIALKETEFPPILLKTGTQRRLVNHLIIRC